MQRLKLKLKESILLIQKFIQTEPIRTQDTDA